LLPSLEDQHPNPAIPACVIFDLLVQVALHPVEQQRLDPAGLGADLEASGSVEFEIGLQSPAKRQLSFS
jgi:hypothetical protein